ncbi:hypothetical protein HanIR_Chr01g0004621 [Helianthus annuus]|nr:hypothetical protein HanIR_Chr01g0004621 [Helianthus annuus]
MKIQTENLTWLTIKSLVQSFVSSYANVYIMTYIYMMMLIEGYSKFLVFSSKIKHLI